MNHSRLRRSVHLALVATAVAIVLSGPARAGELFDPFIALPWGPTGTEPQQGFGETVSLAGDVNGDGYGDVAVGRARAAQGGVENEGGAHIYFGSPQGSSLTPSWTWLTGQVDAFGGEALAPAGDVNGDGYGDFLVAVPFWDAGPDTNVGKVAVFHGGPAGPPLAPNYELFSPTPADHELFGVAVATAGDVNGDGFADVLVGALHRDGGLIRGAAYVYHGSALGLGTSPAQSWLGPMGQDSRFGRSLSTAGDLNADGFADVIIGAPNQATPFPLGGAAYVYLGSAGGLFDDPDTVVVGTVNDEQLGFSVSLAGDVNADGHSDVLIGSPGANSTVGKATVAFGGLGRTLQFSQDVPNPYTVTNELFGRILSTLGDLNGDGYADFGVAGFQAPTFRGRISVYLGRPNLVLEYVGDILSRGEDGYFGSTFGTTGDTDGDGRSEIIVGTEGMSVTPGGFEGRTFQFHPPRTLPALTGGGWPRAGAQMGTRYGSGLAVVRRFTSAIAARLFIGDPGFDGFGRMSVHGPSGTFGVSFNEASSIVGSTSLQGLGTRIVDAGDMNGDGRCDYASSSPTLDNGPAQEAGRVDFHPGAAALFPVASPVVSGSNTFDRVGSALAGRGDVNGDGFHDLLVGAREWDEPGLADCGKAFLFFGSASGPVVASPWTIVGTQAGQGLGAAVALTDLDGDGYTDVVVGSSSPTGATASGKVEVHYGGPAGPSNTAGLLLVPPVPSPSYGMVVVAVGDVNADGIADLGVGAPLENDRGVVRLYEGTLGRSQSMIPIASLAGTQIGERFGEAMAGGGDVDGDGRGDLAIGAPGYSGGHAGEGRVLLFYGAPELPEIPAAFEFQPDLAGAEFGASLAPLRDLDLDGFADLVVGAPGAGRVYPYVANGSRPGRTAVVQPIRPGPLYYFHPARFPDTDEIQAEHWMHTGGLGPGRFRFQAEVVTQNERFTGTPTVTSTNTFDSRTVTFIGGISIPLDPALPDRGLKLRARWVSSSPHFPRTRWFTPEAHASGDHDVWMGGTVLGTSPIGGARMERLAISSVSPNPAGTSLGSSRITFHLPSPAHVTLDVFDLRGARVRRILDGTQSAGTSSVAWDGRDQAGRVAGAGVYMIVLRSTGSSATAKVVRLP